MSTNGHKVVCDYTDKFGDNRRIHRDARGRLAVARDRSTVINSLSNIAAQRLGARIRELRIARGLTMEELAVRAGFTDAMPKARMWSIENAKDGRGGVRLGTLYALASVLGVEAWDLLPANADVLVNAGVVTTKQAPRLAVRGE